MVVPEFGFDPKEASYVTSKELVKRNELFKNNILVNRD